MNLNKKIHFPVLLHKVIDEVETTKGEGLFVDCTMGDGGHSYEILKTLLDQKQKSTLLSLDWDSESLKFVSSYFDKSPVDIDSISKIGAQKWLYAKRNFIQLPQVVDEIRKKGTDQPLLFVLMDLGISSRQYAQKERGFSFDSESKLDMRMDPDTYSVTAYQLLNLLSVAKLTMLFVKTVGIKKIVARKLAQEIVAARDARPFGSKDDVRRINEIAERVQTLRIRSIGKLHPSTLIFLALRIAVNTELQNLYETLQGIRTLIAENGKILVITYHSHEENIVTDFVKIAHLSDKKIKPSKNEVFHNSRARSAILHIIT